MHTRQCGEVLASCLAENPWPHDPPDSTPCFTEEPWSHDPPDSTPCLSKEPWSHEHPDFTSFFTKGSDLLDPASCFEGDFSSFSEMRSPSPNLISSQGTESVATFSVIQCTATNSLPLAVQRQTAGQRLSSKLLVVPAYNYHVKIQIQCMSDLAACLLR